MASAATRNVTAEAAKLEAIAASAGSALACVHENAEELHRALVSDYLEQKHKRGVWARTLQFFSI